MRRGDHSKGSVKGGAPESRESPALASAELQAKACNLAGAIPARSAAASNSRTAVGLTSVAVTRAEGFSCVLQDCEHRPAPVSQLSGMSDTHSIWADQR